VTETEITKIHSWLLERLRRDGALANDAIRLLEEEDRIRALLFLDYLVSQGILSASSAGGRYEYKVQDPSKLAILERPKPSSTGAVRAEGSKLVYSAPASLTIEIQALVSKFPTLQIVPLDDALREVFREAKKGLDIAVPFLEWDGLGYLITEFKDAARRNVRVRLLTRGALFPERSDYPYLEKVKTLLKMFAVFEANALSPEARFEVRDFTSRIANPASVSLHFEGIHQKMVVADRRVAYVGSGEIRAASFLVNGECGVIQTGEAAAFWAEFFDVFWREAKPVTKAQLEGALTISTG